MRLALAAAAAWVAAWLQTLHPASAAAVSAAAFALAVALALAGRRYPRACAAAALALAAVGLVAAGVAAQSGTRNPAALAQLAQGGRLLTVDLEAVSPPRTVPGPSGANQTTFRAVLRRFQSGANPPNTARAPAFVRMPAGTAPGLARGLGAELEPGWTVRADARVAALPPHRTIPFMVTVTGSTTPVAAPAPWKAWANPVRARFLTVSRTLAGDGGDLLPGLALGDTRAVAEGLDQAMRVTSLSHLTAVSGANCAVVVLLVSALAAACGAGRALRAILAVIALGGFVTLVTPDASVTRAAIMAVVALACDVSGRGSRGLPLLALAALAMLGADPWISRDFGFALSVLATAGLIVLAPVLAARLARHLPLWAARLVAVPLAAQVFCQPVLVLLDPSVPLYGVPANMLADAPASAATVLGLLACLLLPVLPGLGQALAQLAWLPAAWIAGLARVAAGLPGASLPWLPGPPGLVAAAAGVAAATVLAFAPAGRRPRIVVAAWACSIVLIGAAAGTAGVRGIRAAVHPGNWQVAACDIGQGDGIVLRSAGRHAVIDVGPEPEAMRRCLRTLGVHRVDLLVLTHDDLDHVGDLDAVLGKTGVALVGPERTAGDRRIAARLAQAGADVRRAAAGDHGMLGGLHWQVLWPVEDGAGLAAGNEQSVTLHVAGEGLRALFLGDLDESAQDALLRRGVPRADIVKVAHHGSADQSADLYAAVHAAVGIISVGAGNRYGHPTTRTLDLLRRAGTTAVRTDTMGLLLVRAARDGRMVVWSQSTPQDTRPPPGRAAR